MLNETLPVFVTAIFAKPFASVNAPLFVPVSIIVAPVRGVESEQSFTITLK
jgi:hypothetical protein